MNKQSRRVGWIDCARGIAIILVVLGHFDQGDHPLCTWISSFHMPFFFILSGVLAAMKNTGSGDSLWLAYVKRARQLLYPYFTFSLLITVYYLLQRKTSTALKVLWYTVTLEGHSVLWFLPAAWMAECILLTLLKKRISLRTSTLSIALITGLYAALQNYLIGGAVPAEEGILFLILNGLCRAGIGFVFMAAGYMGYINKTRFEKISRPLLLLLASVCFTFGMLCGFLNDMPDMHFSVQQNPALYYTAALLQSGGILIFCAHVVRNCPLLEFYGRNSLIIMATHYALPVINLVHRLMTYTGTGIRYADDLLGSAIVMLIESAIIILINRSFPFMVRFPTARKTPPRV